MELPQIGNFCSICGSLDFVPFVCPHCSKQLCGDHASMPNHSCTKLETTTLDSPLQKSKSEFFKCTFCNISETVDIRCYECGFNFCLSHRFPESHECKILQFRNNLKAQKAKLKERQSEVQPKAIKDTLKKPKSAKNEALARKLALMKLKQQAKGDNKIASEERLYFNLKLPNQKIVQVFFNKRLQIGRIIDNLCTQFSLNLKNETSATLSLVHEESNTVLSPSTELMKYEEWNCSDLILKYL